MLKKIFLIFSIFNISFSISEAQTPKTYASSEILLQLKKLNVLGSVLYIAAHPDDENTRLLAYLANEKMYRTGYLSLTRGDGGQNLIGDEQGVDLGLIRTQELLAARRIDGAEQFFSRAYDFGFSKSSEEAISTWGHDKVLSDIVWVIRKFKPDVIITRFPEDSRAGHGHHSASAILASEAFDAAADSTKFTDQLTQGIAIWQAKRLLWNTFNFGSSNTQSENQFKVDVGMYNPLLGKSYGEISALSRSQHKSQGFGVPAQRGTTLEYFQNTKGQAPVNDLLEGVNVSWDRVLSKLNDKANVQLLIDSIIQYYSPSNPEKSVPQLVRLYKKVEAINDVYWREQKLNQIKNAIEICSGLFLDATTNSQYAVRGDTLKIIKVINDRLGINTKVINWTSANVEKELKKNINLIDTLNSLIPINAKLSQPYWLDQPMEKGSFNVSDQQLIGKGENDPMNVDFLINIEGQNFSFKKSIRYKYTDPVKGEIYQPVYVMPQVTVSIQPPLMITFPGDKRNQAATSVYKLYTDGKNIVSANDDLKQMKKGESLLKKLDYDIKNNSALKKSGKQEIKLESESFLHEITYDHIPSIKYFTTPKTVIESIDLKKVGSTIGYITGAGDKVPQALEQMGYKVTTLKESDLTLNNLKQFDAVITGVRAYNTNEWMSNSYAVLMQYVKEGGVLLSQYNTNNFISSVKSKIGPFPFTISRSRVTDETAKVNFLLPNHPVLNYPNKITQKDFEGWIQERSIYNAESIDSNYQRILSMKDTGENEQDGSLIIANYGKGRFIYSGLVFFRELPAGVPGAYRLFANLIANKRKAK